MAINNAAINQNNLGTPVSVRQIDWRQQVINVWGSEYNGPDHGVYEWSNGRKFDSTDKTNSGIYQR